jgi:hypothetical protein
VTSSTTVAPSIHQHNFFLNRLEKISLSLSYQKYGTTMSNISAMQRQ